MEIIITFIAQERALVLQWTTLLLLTSITFLILIQHVKQSCEELELLQIQMHPFGNYKL